jgi:hypothetical protein
MDVFLQLLLGAVISIHALPDEHRLDGGIPKDNACSEQAVNDGGEDLDCSQLALGLLLRLSNVRSRFHLGTSKAPTGSSPTAGVHVPTGLKLILRCLESGLASLLHGSYSMVLNLSASDMTATVYPARRGYEDGGERLPASMEGLESR